MAPVCSAGPPTSSYPRLCFHTFYVDICVLFILVLASRLSENNALITYDRLTLLNLRPPLFHEPELHWDLGDAMLLRTCPSTRTFCLPPPSLFKRRSRKRGKRSGLRVRLKALLKVHAVANSSPIPDFLQFPFTSHRRPSFKLLSHRRICPVGLVSDLYSVVLATSDLEWDFWDSRSTQAPKQVETRLCRGRGD